MTTVGFTRPEDRLEDTVRDAEAAGLVPYAFPSMTVTDVPEENFTKMAELLRSGDVWYTLLASVTAVNELLRHFGGESLAELLSMTNVACTGPFTAKRLKEVTGVESDLVPGTYSGEGVAAELCAESDGRNVLLLRSAKGDAKVNEAFEAAGAIVHDVPVYATVPAEVGPMHLRTFEAIRDGKLDALLFTSAKSYSIIMSQLSDFIGKEEAYDAVRRLFKVSIGMTTTRAMEADGMPPDAVSKVSSLASMFETVKKRFPPQN